MLFTRLSKEWRLAEPNPNVEAISKKIMVVIVVVVVLLAGVAAGVGHALGRRAAHPDNPEERKPGELKPTAVQLLLLRLGIHMLEGADLDILSGAVDTPMINYTEEVKNVRYLLISMHNLYRALLMIFHCRNMLDAAIVPLDERSSGSVSERSRRSIGG